MNAKQLKDDVIVTAHIELVHMLTKLENHYNRPGFEAALPELKKLETTLRECFAKYESEAASD